MIDIAFGIAFPIGCIILVVIICFVGAIIASIHKIDDIHEEVKAISEYLAEQKTKDNTTK
jgi:hypothetical protein